MLKQVKSPPGLEDMLCMTDDSIPDGVVYIFDRSHLRRKEHG